jgi:hypothetical protein
MKQELWKFISLSEKYDICKTTGSPVGLGVSSPTAASIADDINIHIDTSNTVHHQKMANHEVFQVFCNKMEELISNLNDAEFEFTLSNNKTNDKDDSKDDDTKRYDYYNIKY